MAEACPRGRPGSRGASLGYRRPADRAEVPEAQASSKASTRPFFGDPSSAEFSHLTGARSRRRAEPRAVESAALREDPQIIGRTICAGWRTSHNYRRASRRIVASEAEVPLRTSECDRASTALEALRLLERADPGRMVWFRLHRPGQARSVRRPGTRGPQCDPNEHREPGACEPNGGQRPVSGVVGAIAGTDRQSVANAVSSSCSPRWRWCWSSAA